MSSMQSHGTEVGVYTIVEDMSKRYSVSYVEWESKLTE